MPRRSKNAETILRSIHAAALEKRRSENAKRSCAVHRPRRSEKNEKAFLRSVHAVALEKKKNVAKGGLCSRAKAAFGFGKAESFILRYFASRRTY